MHRKIRTLAVVAGGLWLVGCTTGQRPYNSQDALSPEERRFQALENKMAVVNRRLDAIDNSQQGSSLSDEVRDLRGQVQELQHEHDQDQQQLKATLQNYDLRLQQLGSGAAIASAPGSGAASYPGAPTSASSGASSAAATSGYGASQTTAPGQATTPTPQAGGASSAASANNPDEQAAYIRAFNLLQAGKMDQAIAGFKAMLNQYPQGNYADNAWYWLGSAYYVKGDSNDARNSYNSLLSKFPNSPKVPDALLKTGIIYQDQNNRSQAHGIFQRVINSYPNSNAATVAKQRLAKDSG